MRLAVLGTDQRMLPLLAAARSAGHEIVWLGDVRPEDDAAIGQRLPGVARSSNWEVLLDQATADAVLIGRGAASDELRTEQLKRLATDEVPVLATHPVADSVLTYYELDMVRRETRGILQHYNSVAGHPSVAELARWVRDGNDAIGPVYQVSCERRIGDVTRTGVLGALAGDAELLASLTGNIHQVSAVGPCTTDASYASLQVQMTSPVATTLRWSVSPAWHAEGGAEVTLVGERGTSKLNIPECDRVGEGQSWQLETIVAGEQHSRALDPYDSAKAAIERLTRALDEQHLERRAALSDWDKATQSMEVVDAVELSLQKGRTIEVHQQQLTEQLAFRGTMAALGCGLLLVGFVVVVSAALFGGVESLMDQKKIIGAWPVVLLAVLAFFLLLQTVPMLASKPRRKNATSNADDDSSA